MGSFVKDVGSAIITGPATLAAGYMQSKSANKATKAQQEANAAALAFEREKYADTRANYEKAMGAYQNQWNAWNQGRMALLQRYGVDVAPFQQAGAPASGPTIASLAQGQAPQEPPALVPLKQFEAQPAGLAELLTKRPMVQ